MKNFCRALQLVPLFLVPLPLHADHTPRPGTYEIDAIQTTPSVVSESQSFDVTITGYNVAGSYGLVADPSLYEVTIEDQLITINTLVEDACDFSARPPPPPNVAPQRLTFAMPGVAAGEYLLLVDHSDDCLGQTQATRPLRVYPNTQPALQFFHETPSQGQTVSGVGVIRGWSCYPKEEGYQLTWGPSIGKIAYRIDDGPLVAIAYGGSRTDTEAFCGEGNVQTGYAAAEFWGNYGAGTHEIRLYVDSVEQSVTTFDVIEPAEGFMQGIEASFDLVDFPVPGRDARLEWSEADQNFIIVDYE